MFTSVLYANRFKTALLILILIMRDDEGRLVAVAIVAIIRLIDNWTSIVNVSACIGCSIIEIKEDLVVLVVLNMATIKISRLAIEVFMSAVNTATTSF